MLPLVVSVGILAFIGCIRTQTDSGEYFELRGAKKSMVNDVVVFKVMVNGATTGYDTNTGIYTCRIPGHYSFSANFEYKSIAHPETSCTIRKNNDDLVSTVSDSQYSYAHASVNVSLAAGDTVYLGNCNGWHDIKKYTFSFRGGLQKEM